MFSSASIRNPWSKTYITTNTWNISITTESDEDWLACAQTLTIDVRGSVYVQAGACITHQTLQLPAYVPTSLQTTYHNFELHYQITIYIQKDYLWLN